MLCIWCSLSDGVLRVPAPHVTCIGFHLIAAICCSDETTRGEQSKLCRAQVLTGMFSTTSGKIDDRWQRFMKFQIARTRGYFADAEGGIDNLDADARWPVWSALILYRCVTPLHASVP